MSLNISAAQIAIRTGAISELFDLTARDITIYKEPVKTIINNPSNILVGYQDNSATNQEITYTPVYQTFSGRLISQFKSKGQGTTLFDGKVNLDPNSIYIKVRKDAKDYINNGIKTELIKIDDTSYKLNDISQTQNYYGLKFYYYEIEATN